jgi:hypothetical protein
LDSKFPYGKFGEDIDHVQKYRTFLDSTHPISIHTDKDGHTSCRLGFSARKLASTLRRYGAMPRKSFSAKIGGGLEYDKDVWRGIIDADGTLGKNGNRRISLCSASYRLMVQFKARKDCWKTADNKDWARRFDIYINAVWLYHGQGNFRVIQRLFHCTRSQIRKGKADNVSSQEECRNLVAYERM